MVSPCGVSGTGLCGIQWDSDFILNRRDKGGVKRQKVHSCHPDTRTEYMDVGVGGDSSESGADPVRSR